MVPCLNGRTSPARGALGCVALEGIPQLLRGDSIFRFGILLVFERLHVSLLDQMEQLERLSRSPIPGDRLGLRFGFRIEVY